MLILNFKKGVGIFQSLKCALNHNQHNLFTGRNKLERTIPLSLLK